VQGWAAIDLLGLSRAERGRARGDVCTAHIRFGRATARAAAIAAAMERLKQRAAEEEETRKGLNIANTVAALVHAVQGVGR
jgi:hypothetical protein